MGTPIDVDALTTIVGLGSLIKRRNIAVEISYGSGGFCVVLKTTKAVFHGYSWDLTDAFQKALAQTRSSSIQSILQDYIVSVDEDYDDVPTQPDIRVDDFRKQLK
jgi:hypothetical protein